jgi:hypothetical protein
VAKNMTRLKGSKDKTARTPRGYGKKTAFGVQKGEHEDKRTVEDVVEDPTQDTPIQAFDDILSEKHRHVSNKIEKLRKLFSIITEKLPNLLTNGQKKFLRHPEMRAIDYKSGKVLIELDINDPFSMVAYWKELYDEYINNLKLQQGAKDITEGKGDDKLRMALTPKLDDFLKSQLANPNQYKEIDRKNGIINFKRMTCKDIADYLNGHGGVKKGNETIGPVTPDMVKNWIRKDRLMGGKNRLKNT